MAGPTTSPPSTPPISTPGVKLVSCAPDCLEVLDISFVITLLSGSSPEISDSLPTPPFGELGFTTSWNSSVYAVEIKLNV